ncbi:hypothetical protein POPTR_009G144550v4 [Populus trichocarpa]|uniref:Uncharacterized protein n=1 Tax=Populus trichocarpa TaxID=3694 RepID=A0ACC0SID7_POPTR|nr:hypothetical protein POPTR_009G144550v4 [Populus trichocarpa]
MPPKYSDQVNSMFKTIAVGAILAIGWINQIPCRQLHLAVLIWPFVFENQLERPLSCVHTTTLPLIFARSRVLSMQKLCVGGGWSSYSIH